MTDGNPVLDPAVLETLRQLTPDGEPDVLREVLTLFLSDASGRLAAIGAAVERQDAPGLQRSAHTLKGAAGTIGAAALQAACRALEELGRRGAVDGAPRELERVSAELARVERAIAQLL